MPIRIGSRISPAIASQYMDSMARLLCGSESITEEWTCVPGCVPEGPMVQLTLAQYGASRLVHVDLLPGKPKRLIFFSLFSGGIRKTSFA